MTAPRCVGLVLVAAETSHRARGVVAERIIMCSRWKPPPAVVATSPPPAPALPSFGRPCDGHGLAASVSWVALAANADLCVELERRMMFSCVSEEWLPSPLLLLPARDRLKDAIAIPPRPSACARSPQHPTRTQGRCEKYEKRLSRKRCGGMSGSRNRRV